MKLKRNRGFYDICRKITSAAMGYHNIRFHGAENIPEKGPVLLLPKHQYLKDIPLEGLFLAKKSKRPANWVMKFELFRFLEYTGGIGIIRPDKLRELKEKERRARNETLKLKYKKQRTELAEKIRDYNPKAMDYLEWLYTQGEIIVVHPEGKRLVGEMLPLKKEFLTFTKKIQEKYNIKIPLIPMGIEYAPGFRINMRAGKQLDAANPDISDVVKEEIRKLSNLD